MELPGSIELDATPGKEQLVAVFSQEPLEVAPVMCLFGSLPQRDLTKEEIPGATHLLLFEFDKELP